jgi:hypothetical protein
MGLMLFMAMAMSTRQRFSPIILDLELPGKENNWMIIFYLCLLILVSVLNILNFFILEVTIHVHMLGSDHIRLYRSTITRSI